MSKVSKKAETAKYLYRIKNGPSHGVKGSKWLFSLLADPVQQVYHWKKDNKSINLTLGSHDL